MNDVEYEFDVERYSYCIFQIDRYLKRVVSSKYVYPGIQKSASNITST